MWDMNNAHLNNAYLHVSQLLLTDKRKILSDALGKSKRKLELVERFLERSVLRASADDRRRRVCLSRFSFPSLESLDSERAE